MEPKSSLQVPLLLKLGESKKALLSATQSGDTDLVYTVLLQLKETSQMGDFQMIIRKIPLAQNLYKKYCTMYSKSALQEIFMQEDDFLAQAEFSLREGIVSNQQADSVCLSLNLIQNFNHRILMLLHRFQQYPMPTKSNTKISKRNYVMMLVNY